MPSLAETVAALVRRRRNAAHAEARGAGRLTSVKGFEPNPGGLRMFSYRPPGLAPGAPLVVVLHGCGQTAAFAEAAGWLALADRCGFAVVAPQQRQANNVNRCFNWFRRKDVSQGEGEAASIRAIAAEGLALGAGDPDRVFVVGLSAGGAMALGVLAAYPEAFAGGAILAGMPYGAAEGLAAALKAMRGGAPARSAEALAAPVRAASRHTGPWPRLSVWHGEADKVVNPRNAEAIARQWAAVHGLPEAPSREVRRAGRRRSEWCDPRGRTLVELHMLEGFGHGAPAAGAGPGRPDPFVIDCGISAALEIAAFWGLAETTGESADRPADRPRGGWLRRTLLGR